MSSNGEAANNSTTFASLFTGGIAAAPLQCVKPVVINHAVERRDTVP